MFFLDPFSMTPKRALDSIAAELQRQYERWQSKARYKSSLDPTQEDVKKLCVTLRRNARVRIELSLFLTNFSFLIYLGRTYFISL